MHKNCKYCGKQFVCRSDKRKFCNQECDIKSRQRNRQFKVDGMIKMWNEGNSCIKIAKAYKTCTTQILYYLNQAGICTKQRHYLGWEHHGWKGCEGLGSAIISKFRHRALTKGMEFTIDAKFLWNKYLNQNKKCALSGELLNIEQRYDYAKKAAIDTNASIDRIDSTKGYTQDNVQWTTKRINQMKLDSSDEEFIKLCHIVSDFNPKPLESQENGTGI
jgi:hypothetical protein